MTPEEATRLAHGLPDRLHAQQLSLERAYERVLAAAARDAARRFSKTALVAAGDWHQPNADDLYDVRATSEKLAAATAAARRRLIAKVFKAYGFDVKNPAVEGVIAQLGRHITNVVAHQRDAIMAAIDRAWQAGLSIPHTADLIRTEGVEMAATRATTIARTEMIGAVNGGSLAVVRAGSSAKYKQWLATNDERTRDDHRDVDGRVVGVDEPFSVGGSHLMFPGDPGGAPAEVINCRCTLIYTDDAEGLSADAGIVEGDAMDTVTAADTTEEAPVAAEGDASRNWRAVIYQEGTPFVDGRMIEVGATTWRDLPLTIYYLNDIPDYGHTGAVAAGSIQTMERDAQNNIVATGVFDDSEIGREAARVVGDEIITGVSVDMAPQTVEMRVAAELLDQEPDGDPVAAASNGDGEMVVVDEMNVNDVMQVVTAGLILSVTIVGQGASNEGKISLVASATGDRWQIPGGLIASAPAPELPTEAPEAPSPAVPATAGADPLTLVAGVLRGLSEGALMGGVLRGMAEAIEAGAAKPDPYAAILEMLARERTADRDQVALIASALSEAATRPPGDLHVHTPPVHVETGEVTVQPAPTPDIHVTVEGRKGTLKVIRDEAGNPASYVFSEDKP